MTCNKVTSWIQIHNIWKAWLQGEISDWWSGLLDPVWLYSQEHIQAPNEEGREWTLDWQMNSLHLYLKWKRFFKATWLLWKIEVLNSVNRTPSSSSSFPTSVPDGEMERSRWSETREGEGEKGGVEYPAAEFPFGADWESNGVRPGEDSSGFYSHLFPILRVPSSILRWTRLWRTSTIVFVFLVLRLIIVFLPALFQIYIQSIKQPGNGGNNQQSTIQLKSCIHLIT